MLRIFEGCTWKSWVNLNSAHSKAVESERRPMARMRDFERGTWQRYVNLNARTWQIWVNSNVAYSKVAWIRTCYMARTCYFERDILQHCANEKDAVVAASTGALLWVLNGVDILFLKWWWRYKSLSLRGYSSREDKICVPLPLIVDSVF